MVHRLLRSGLLSGCLGVMLVSVLVAGQGGGPVVPQGIIPVPVEPGIVVSLATDKASYAPGDALKLTFTLNRDAYVYLYNLTSDGKVKLLVPNRFVQNPRFPAGKHTLPTTGWSLRVTEPEGFEYLQLVASEGPLSFYEAKAFEKDAFLQFANPVAFSAQLQTLLPGSRWGTAWTGFRVYRPRATLNVTTSPSGAGVWVGGAYLGTSPLSTTIAPGRVRVRLDKTGYESQSFNLTVADGDEVSLVVALSRARPSLWTPPTPSPRPVDGDVPTLGLGLAVGLDSVAADLWAEWLGIGMSLRPGPPLPDLSLPGPGGWFPWGPEVEGYFAGWLSLGPIGALILGGLSVQEMAWIPAWYPAGSVTPSVEIEPDTRYEVRLTWGVGLGVSGSGWRAYLLLHSRRNLVLGFTITP